MMKLKTLIRNLLWCVNFRTMIQVTMRWLPRGKRTFFIFEGKNYSYRETYEQSVRYARFFLAQREKAIQEGRIGIKDKLAIGIYQENTPEFLFASFGTALSNSVLFAINTGFKGKTLANVINQARISILIVSPGTALEVRKCLSEIHVLIPDGVFIIGDEATDGEQGFASLETAISDSETNPPPASDSNSKSKMISRRRGLRRRRRTVSTLRSRRRANEDSVLIWNWNKAPMDNTSPVLVIYTSGTTGMPKGVPCTHLKMIGAGFVVQSAVHLTAKDRGYICMPLFHSNAWYIGILPTMIAGSSFVLKRSFSASAFEEDMLTHGVTFMNYVGQTLHYIISALEKKYGSGDAVEKSLANHPKNKFRIAYGNGAPPIDRQKCIRYLGMEHIYEIYGSTEAVITTANKPGDPIDCVGRVARSVVILNEQDQPCLPGVVDEKGRLMNYQEAVGEICKKAGTDNLRFDGYFANQDATLKKFRNGYYHSGDLGHIRIVGRKRYLYFNGRTDDWIRKDGENFSAENLVEYALKIPGVKLAIAYGAPCEVSDEKVMIAIQLKDHAVFDPQLAFDEFINMQRKSGMDPKWMPDYIRLYDAFDVTDTQKIMVRPFKTQHFNIEKYPDMMIHYRERGDNAYHRLTKQAFEVIRDKFIQTGREGLL
jgi:fatty-acyl-CoA synthase